MLNSLQQRFLLAYTATPTIAGACRAAGVHRATVYRWKADPAFVFALDAAFEVWHRAHLARLRHVDAVRAVERQANEAARRPTRLRNLEAARAAKR